VLAAKIAQHPEIGGAEADEGVLDEIVGLRPVAVPATDRGEDGRGDDRLRQSDEALPCARRAGFEAIAQKP
jgi:hypothetical protein